MSLSLNERLRELRKQQGLTQEQLAQRVHVSRQTISNWETGRATPDYEMLTLLAEVLDISLADLLGSPETEAAPGPAATGPEEGGPVAPSSLRQKQLFAAAAAVLLLCALFFLLGRSFPHQASPADPPRSMEWYQERIQPSEGQPYLTISAREPTVPLIDISLENAYCWQFDLFIQETGGHPFQIDLIRWCFFFENGRWTFEQNTPQELQMGGGHIGAYSLRYIRCQDTSHVPLLGRGVEVIGKDENGIERSFRTFIPYEQPK